MENNSIKEDIARKIEPYFRQLFGKGRHEYENLDVTSFSNEDVKAMFLCFKDSVSSKFKFDDFIKIDLNILSKQRFNPCFVEDILSDILSDESVFPLHKVHYTLHDVRPFFFKIEFIFLTKVKEYIRSIIDKEVPTKKYLSSSNVFSRPPPTNSSDEPGSPEYIDLADFDYIQDEEFTEDLNLNLQSKTSTDSEPKSLPQIGQSIFAKESSINNNQLYLASFDMERLIKEANARIALDQARRLQLNEQHGDFESIEVNGEDDESDNNESSLEDSENDNVHTTFPDNDIDSVDMENDDLLTLFKCEKISLLKPMPLLPEDDDQDDIVTDILNRSSVFSRRRKIKPSTNAESSISASDLVNGHHDDLENEGNDSENKKNEQENQDRSKLLPSPIQPNGSPDDQDGVLTEEIPKNDEVNDSSIFKITVPSVPIFDKKPKCSNIQDTNDEKEENGDQAPNENEFLESGSELDNLVIVEDPLSDEISTSNIQEKDEPQEEPREESCPDMASSEAEYEIQPPGTPSNGYDNSDLDDDVPIKFTLKRRRSKTVLSDSESQKSSSTKGEENASTSSGNKKMKIMNEQSDKEDEDTAMKSESDDDDGSFDVKKKLRRAKRIVDSDDEKNDSDDSEEKKGNVEDVDEDSNGPSNSEEKNENDSDDDQTLDVKKKKKRRAKRLTSDDSKPDTSGSKARNSKPKSIRKIIDDDALEEETISAQKAEEEKAKRIAEKQKLYNSVLMTSLKDSTLKKDRLILDVTENKEVLVEVHEHFLQYLKPHQMDGIKFMFDRSIETVSQIKSESSNPSGAILAHSMGLGKTLQTVCFVHTIMTNSHLKEFFKRVLIIAPANVIKNWYEEFLKWIGPDMADIDVWEMSRAQVRERIQFLKTWFENGGVLLITINLYSQLVMQNDKKKKKKKPEKEKENPYLKYLVDPGPDLVIIDEGHLLKNDKSKINQAVSQIKTLRRIVLTGTPLQNNLSEYYVMVNFVKPRLLGTKPEFRNRFENPIKHGQHSDSSAADVKVMKKRVHILTRKLKDIIHRCDYRVLVPYLPPKNEYVLKITLTPEQIELYKSYLKNFSAMAHATLFRDYHALGYIWNHPLLLKTFDTDSNASSDINDFIDYSSPESSNFVEEDDDDEIEFLGSFERSGKDGTVGSFIPNVNVKKEKNGDEPDVTVVKPEFSNKQEWVKKNLPEEDDMTPEQMIEQSTKFILLFEILDRCEVIGDKIIVFSQSLNTLNLIERVLALQMNQLLMKNTNYVNMTYDQIVVANKGISHMWQENFDYLRIDGNSAIERRMKCIKQFNDPENTRTRLMLVSTKAGGVGINLFGANRCIIFDTSWNPANDLQAIFRIFRYGQTKPVYIYRFVSCGTMEQKIYERQVLKQSLSHRVVDEKQIGRFFKSSDIEELYEFRCDYDDMRKIPKVPTDNLLAEVMSKHKDLIVETLEHDSLLENRPEEELTEEERLQAWEEFHNPSYVGDATGFNDAVNLLPRPQVPNFPQSLLQVIDNNKFDSQNYLSYSSNAQSSYQYSAAQANTQQQQSNINIGRVVPNVGHGRSMVSTVPQNFPYNSQTLSAQTPEAAQNAASYNPQLSAFQEEQNRRQQLLTQQHYQLQQRLLQNPQRTQPGPSNNHNSGHVQQAYYTSIVDSFNDHRLLATFGNKNDRSIEIELVRFFALNNNSPDKQKIIQLICSLFIRRINFYIAEKKNQNTLDSSLSSLYQMVHSFTMLYKRSQSKVEEIFLE